jgi:CBS domain containing-hemolysin-like protein
MIVFLLAVATALVVSFLCSIFESVLLSVGYAQVEALNKSGSRAGRILERFKREMDVPIAAILILNTIAHTVGASVAGATYGDVMDPSTLWIFSIVFTVAILLFTEIIPKTIGISFAGRLAAPVALSVQGLVVALRPVLFVTRAIARLLRPGKKPPVTSVEEIRLLAAVGRAEGVVGEHTASIIVGASELRELTAVHVMVPRTRVVWLSGTQSLEENLEVLRKSGLSRAPFSSDGDLDHAEGVILTKELLFQAKGAEKLDWNALLIPPVIVPETSSLQALLRKFQKEQRHMAFVIDEHGGLSGIVTLEDVLEELVGEIWDESDRRRPDVVVRPDGGATCHGLAETRKVAERLGVQLETKAVTLSGFLAEKLGELPRVGAVVEDSGYRFEVTLANPRRAEQIEVTPLPGE